MPYKKGSLKGQLTTAEIRKLISAHNKLSKITIPPRSTRDTIMKIISKAGFRVNHGEQKLEQTKATKKDISLEKAKDITKRVPKTEEQKKQSQERMEKKKVEKEKEIKLAKKEGVKEFKQKKAEAQKKKPVEKPKKKTTTMGTQTDEKPKPKKEEKKETLQLEDKKKDEKPAKTEKTFKVERTERSQMINQLSSEMGKKFNPFKILGITAREETPELVKKKCRELRLKNHPDKGGDKNKFDLIQKACDILLKTQTILKKKSGNDKDKGEAVKKPVSVKDIFDELVANSDEKILPFTSFPASSMLFYAEILERNKNDCSLPLPVLLETITKLGMLKFLKDYSEEIAKEILRCHKHSKGKKAVVLPLTFKNKKSGSTHANAIVFNTLQMTAEHFEPHGIKDYVPARKGWLELEGVNLAGGINAINKELKILAKKEGLKEFSKGLKYVRPVDVCPSESMYKNFKGVYSETIPKKEPVDFEGFTIKEKGGYCQLWTYFLLDLRLKTLDKPPQEVLKEYATYRDIYKNSIGSDPNKSMMGLIRGYSNMYFNIIRKLINEGKFSMEEFIKYRDYNSLKGDLTGEARKFLNENFNKITASINKEASEKMERVMKDAKM